jgi:hypothetical protein
MTQSSFATRSLPQLVHPPVADRLRPSEEAARRSAAQVTFCVRGVASPLLANIYMNRFLKYWRLTKRGEAFRAHVIAYADDFVILSRGHAAEALAWTKR